MSDSDIVSRMARLEVIEEFRHVKSLGHRYYHSSTSIKSQVADRVLNWNRLGLRRYRITRHYSQTALHVPSLTISMKFAGVQDWSHNLNFVI